MVALKTTHDKCQKQAEQLRQLSEEASRQLADRAELHAEISRLRESAGRQRERAGQLHRQLAASHRESSALRHQVALQQRQLSAARRRLQEAGLAPPSLEQANRGSDEMDVQLSVAAAPELCDAEDRSDSPDISSMTEEEIARRLVQLQRAGHQSLQQSFDEVLSGLQRAAAVDVAAAPRPAQLSQALRRNNDLLRRSVESLRRLQQSDARLLASSSGDARLLASSSGDARLLASSSGDARLLASSSGDARLLASSSGDARLLASSSGDARLLASSSGDARLLASSSGDACLLASSSGDARLLASSSGGLGAERADSSLPPLHEIPLTGSPPSGRPGTADRATGAPSGRWPDPAAGAEPPTCPICGQVFRPPATRRELEDHVYAHVLDMTAEEEALSADLSPPSSAAAAARAAV
ncbi:Protein SON [Amphibalanus amphitrite]|uniref:Protein SON n=1 Tax=Amphibalanus amphitrite TaxID=1232801 RepID=A0A6A4WZ42_AMPAM|nr:Protein SON [Amphibalanus amphitrite]